MTTNSNTPPTLGIILCAVLEEEFRHYAKAMPHVAKLVVLEQGLHNEPAKLRATLQAAIDDMESDPHIQAIALGYGLCSRGSDGVFAHRCRLAIPRAHDCITILLGDKDRYQRYMDGNAGTYWYSPGWNKHHIPPGQQRYEKLLKQYVDAYGQDNAEFLMESEQHWFKTYTRATYVHLGVGQTPADIAFTQECAKWLKWEFDMQEGDPSLLLALLGGNWDAERFVVVEPGEAIRMTGDIDVMTAGPHLEKTEPAQTHLPILHEEGSHGPAHSR